MIYVVWEYGVLHIVDVVVDALLNEVK